MKRGIVACLPLRPRAGMFRVALLCGCQGAGEALKKVSLIYKENLEAKRQEKLQISFQKFVKSTQSARNRILYRALGNTLGARDLRFAKP